MILFKLFFKLKQNVYCKLFSGIILFYFTIANDNLYTTIKKNGFRKESADLHCKESINKNIHRLETFLKFQACCL